MLYAIQASVDGPIKLGSARDPEQRLVALQIAQHDTLRLIATWEGTSRDEAALHHRFAALRIRGEWFQPAPELLRAIASYGLHDRPKLSTHGRRRRPSHRARHRHGDPGPPAQLHTSASPGTAPLLDAMVARSLHIPLTPIELARAFAERLRMSGTTHEDLARTLGMSRPAVSNHLRLLNLPDDVLKLIDTGALTFAHGRALLLCDEHATRWRLARRAVDEGWSTRQLEQAAREAGTPRASATASAGQSQ